MGGRVLASLSVVGVLAAGCAVPPPVGGGGGSSGASPKVGGCKVFPSDSAWNTPVDNARVRSDSATFIANISSDAQHSKLHPDFGGGGAYGIPFKVVPSSEPKRTVNYTAYGDESDPGPYPIPPNAPVEGGSGSDGDRHVLVVQQGTCHLYELGRAFWDSAHNRWNADVGVNWNLSSNALRPLHFTSADAAGLPILAGLVRYDEVAAGHVDHALRFTVPHTQKGFILPATHYASSSTNPALPPMGLRLRLKASFDLSRYHGQSLVILEALKKYGMIVADNGSSWFITGASDSHWNDDDLNQMKNVPGTAFEVVDTGSVRH
jgi:hypothetical protein